MKITLDKSQALSGGAFNQDIHDWRVLGAKTEASNGHVVVTDVPSNAIDLAGVFDLVNASVDVTGYAAWIVMAASDLMQEIPEGLPNRLDDEGNPHTWLTWRAETQQIQYSEDVSQAKFGGNPFMDDLSGAHLKIIDDLAYATVVDAGGQDKNGTQIWVD